MVSVTISNTNGSDSGFYPITVTGTSASVVKTVPLYLELFNAAFAEVTLNSPANEEASVSITPTLSWTPEANATLYDVQIATDSEFATIIAFATVDQASYTAPVLSEASTYYWRVMPKNPACGGTFGEAFSFMTGQIV